MSKVAEVCPNCNQTIGQGVAAAFGRTTLSGLEQERKACLMSRFELAEIVGTSTTQVYRIERQGQMVNRAQARDFAEALGATVDELREP